MSKAACELSFEPFFPDEDSFSSTWRGNLLGFAGSPGGEGLEAV